MTETVINAGTKGYSHLVLVESADANSASKLFLALTNINEFFSKKDDSKSKEDKKK